MRPFRSLTMLTIALALLPVMGSCAFASPAPRTIGFMGMLKSAAGAAQNGPVAVTLSLYDTDTGGPALWSEQQTVNAVNGLFSTALGKVTAFPSSLDFTQAYFVGVRVEGDDHDLAPRIPLQGVPYALLAQNVPDNTVSSAKLANDSASLTKVSGGVMASSGSAIGIGTTTPVSQLMVAQNTDASAVVTIDSGSSTGEFSAIDFRDRGTAKWGLGKSPTNDFYVDESGVGRRFTIQGGGNVGVGTSNPTAQFQVGNGGADGTMLYLNGGTAALKAGTSGGRSTVGATGDIAFTTLDGLTDRLVVGQAGGAGTLDVKGSLKVRGDVSLGSDLSLSAIGSNENTRIITGIINGSGTPSVFAGTGFSVTRIGTQTGAYHVVFTPAFTGLAITTATPLRAANGLAAQTNNIGGGSIDIFLSTPTGGVDTYFAFIAIGIR